MIDYMDGVARALDKALRARERAGNAHRVEQADDELAEALGGAQIVLVTLEDPVLISKNPSSTIEPVTNINLNNQIAQEGCDRCWCGSKYWENDHCIDCGTAIGDIKRFEIVVPGSVFDGVEVPAETWEVVVFPHKDQPERGFYAPIKAEAVGSFLPDDKLSTYGFSADEAEASIRFMITGAATAANDES